MMAVGHITGVGYWSVMINIVMANATNATP